MKIRVEVTQAEIEQMNCDTVHGVEQSIRDQLEKAVLDGETGKDWMPSYALEVVVTS